MQLEKVRAAFQRKGYTPNAYIDKKEYYRILNSLAAGGDFHEQVADELWIQAAGDRPSKQIRVNQICATIVEAQNILQARIAENKEQIRELESEKRKLQASSGAQSLRRIEDINNRLEQLYGEKQSFEDDYRLVTEPFGIQLMASVLRNQQPGSALHSPGSPSGYPRDSRNTENFYETSHEGHVESPDLKFLLYLTLGFGLIEVIMIYGKYDFLNLIVLTCLLSIYLMNFFDKAYIRLALALLAISIILDIVWLIMQAGPNWNPPQVSNHSQYQKGYMRFIVFFTIVLIFVKGGITFFLFKHRNTNSTDKYQISLGLMKIMLDGNKGNPFSKEITVLAQN